MDLRRSDFVAMGCIAAGVAFPFMLANFVAPAWSGATTAEATTTAPVFEFEYQPCLVGEEGAPDARVLAIVRMDDGESVIRVRSETLRLESVSKELQALRAKLEKEQMELRRIADQAEGLTPNQAADAELLREEIRALERQIEAEQNKDASASETGAVRRYQVVLDNMRQELAQQESRLNADDQQHKRKKRRKRRRRPC